MQLGLDRHRLLNDDSDVIRDCLESALLASSRSEASHDPIE